MKISNLIHDGRHIDINLFINIYKSPDTGRYKVFISQDGATGPTYDVPYDVNTTEDISKCLKTYLETYCVESEDEE